MNKSLNQSVTKRQVVHGMYCERWVCGIRLKAILRGRPFPLDLSSLGKAKSRHNIEELALSAFISQPVEFRLVNLRADSSGLVLWLCE